MFLVSLMSLCFSRFLSLSLSGSSEFLCVGGGWCKMG